MGEQLYHSALHGQQLIPVIYNSVLDMTAIFQDVESQDNWKKDVPSEWVDTIVADVDAQKNREAQMPFSDAYMAGMPASKRRKVCYE